ncbi:MAG: type II toxin-antitoxin system RelE family toxin [bacterium]
MNVTYRKTFLKDLAKIPSKTRTRIEYLVFNEIPESRSITDIHKFEKLKGYQPYYKIRIGSYRIGVKINDDHLIFCRVLHRRDIYRYFP